MYLVSIHTTLAFLGALLLLPSRAVAASYYVNSSTGRADGTGSLSAPWLKLAQLKTRTYSPGDVVHVDGEFPTETLQFTVIGTPTARIQVIGHSTDGATGVAVVQNIFLTNAEYADFSNFNVGWSGTVSATSRPTFDAVRLTGNAHDLLFDTMALHDGAEGVDISQQSKVDTCTNILFRNVSITRMANNGVVLQDMCGDNIDFDGGTITYTGLYPLYAGATHGIYASGGHEHTFNALEFAHNLHGAAISLRRGASTVSNCTFHSTPSSENVRTFTNRMVNYNNEDPANSRLPIRIFRNTFIGGSAAGSQIAFYLGNANDGATETPSNRFVFSNNTFIGCRVDLSGTVTYGEKFDVTFCNNLFLDTYLTSDVASAGFTHTYSHNAWWGQHSKPADYDGGQTELIADPVLIDRSITAEAYRDRGTSMIADIPEITYSGSAPDIGREETFPKPVPSTPGSILSYAGTYRGVTEEGDPWSLQVDDYGASTFLAHFPHLHRVVVTRGFSVGQNGAFAFSSGELSAAGISTDFRDQQLNGAIRGQILANGSVSGWITPRGIPLAGQKTVGTISTGYYRSVALAHTLAELHVIAGADGKAFLVMIDATGSRSGLGTVSADGTFAVTTADAGYSGRCVAASAALEATGTTSAGSTILFASPGSASSSERLFNISTRGSYASGSTTLIAGFVVTGTTPKDILIRAVGPSLGGFGVTGSHPDPRLRICRDGVVLAENDDWSSAGSSSGIAEATARVGAFALTGASADAAILTQLTPGGYSAEVTGNNSGIVLVEVYDAARAPTNDSKLINISSRGHVGGGDAIMIVGIVVSGTAPKKLLLRAVGPGLAAYGVNNALSNPRLQLCQGDSIVAENDDWEESVDCSRTIEAAVSVGAFPLAAGSKDAALVLYLRPGKYTALISGVGSTSGIALAEAYDVP